MPEEKGLANLTKTNLFWEKYVWENIFRKILFYQFQKKTSQGAYNYSDMISKSQQGFQGFLNIFKYAFLNCFIKGTLGGHLL